jgi:putative aldouronate transport system substrate-binding protein
MFRCIERIRRCVLFGLAAVAAVIALNACRPAEGTTAGQQTDTRTTEQRSIFAFLDTIIQDWEGQAEFEAEYERLTGIKLTIVQPPHQQYNDRLMIQLASGVLPDVCEVLPEYLPTLVLDRIAVPVDQFIGGAQYIDSVLPEFLESVRYSDGALYGIPARDGGGCVTYVRKDWLDRLGLAIPTDWESFVEVLRAFTYDDPDGNGVDDTYGYTDVHAASEDWYNRAVFLDAHAEIYYRDGGWVDGFAEPAIRGAMERLSLLCREGLIDPSFVTNTTQSARTAFFNGKVGVITYWANHWARNLVERTRATVGEHAQVVPIPALAETQYIRRVPPILVVTRGAEDPQWVFTNFIDRQYDKGAIQTLFTYGVEDYHWSIIDGEMKFLVNDQDPYGAQFTKAFVPPNAILNDWHRPMRLDALVVDALAVLNASPYTERLKTGGLSFRRYYDEIERVLKADILSRVATGHLGIDAALAEYRRASEELQIESLLEELNSTSGDR